MPTATSKRFGSPWSQSQFNACQANILTLVRIVHFYNFATKQTEESKSDSFFYQRSQTANTDFEEKPGQTFSLSFIWSGSSHFHEKGFEILIRVIVGTSQKFFRHSIWSRKSVLTIDRRRKILEMLPSSPSVHVGGLVVALLAIGFHETEARARLREEKQRSVASHCGCHELQALQDLR